MVSNHSLADKKILVTCGPTWIPIDDIRIISNKSTGELGQLVSKDLANAGAKVTLLEGPVSQALESYAIRKIKFYFYDEFFKLIKKELKRNYDVIIHAAAVSDYKLKKRFRTKLSSQINHLQLDFVPTQKIIHSIKDINPKTFLVGFKLESNVSKISVKDICRDLFEKAQCDLVVANTTTEKKYSGYILNKANKILAHEKSRSGISASLVRILKEQI